MCVFCSTMRTGNRWKSWQCLLSTIGDEVLGANWSWEETIGMLDIWISKSRIGISPDLEILSCKFFGHQRVKFERGSQPRPDLFEVLDLQNGRRGTVQLKHLYSGLQYMLSRDTDFLSLKPAKETNTIVAP